MKDYDKLEEVVFNENVIKVLDSMRLEGEGGLFLETVEIMENFSKYNVYVESSGGDGLTRCAELSCKVINGIRNWYIS